MSAGGVVSWVMVSDMLPPEKVPVLFSCGEIIAVGELNGLGLCCDEFDESDIKYWMYLPEEPPEHGGVVDDKPHRERIVTVTINEEYLDE